MPTAEKTCVDFPINQQNGASLAKKCVSGVLVTKQCVLGCLQPFPNGYWLNFHELRNTLENIVKGFGSCFSKLLSPQIR